MANNPTPDASESGEEFDSAYWPDESPDSPDAPSGETWITAEMECDICDHYWIATYPATADALQCPQCDHMNRVPRDEEDDLNG